MAVVLRSDTYLSVEDADDYWELRGDETWAAADSGAKENALRAATAYLDANFRWVGRLADCEQKLGWPRMSTRGCDDQPPRDTEGRLLSDIPQRVQDATAELAKLALGGPLVSMQLDGQQGPIKMEKMGPAQIEYDTSGGKADGGYTYVISLLYGIGSFRKGNGAVKVVRA